MDSQSFEHFPTPFPYVKGFYSAALELSGVKSPAREERRAMGLVCRLLRASN